MDNNTTRRSVLKGIGVTSAMGGIVASSNAQKESTVSVVEAGLRFEVPENENYHLMHYDSRPAYTIRKKERKLVLLKNHISDGEIDDIKSGSAILNERITDPKTEIIVGPSDGVLEKLPLRLSSRMRPKQILPLESQIKIPKVSIIKEENGVSVNANHEIKNEISDNYRSVVELKSINAQVRTSRIVGEASIDGVPDYMQGIKREYDSTTIQATPVIEIRDWGELTVSSHRISTDVPPINPDEMENKNDDRQVD